jgi:hypothetical protein
MESLSQDSQSYGRNFKLGLPEGEVSVLTCQLRFFLFVTQCDFVDCYQRFGGKYVLHLRGVIQSSFRFNAIQLPSFLNLLLSPFLLTSPLQPIDPYKGLISQQYSFIHWRWRWYSPTKPLFITTYLLHDVITQKPKLVKSMLNSTAVVIGLI